MLRFFRLLSSLFPLQTPSDRVVRTAAVIALVSGCFPDVSVEPGVQLSCNSDDDCPDGFSCKANDDESFCVAGEVLAKTPLKLVNDLVVAPGVVAAVAPNNLVTATFSFNEAPLALAVSLDGEDFDCAADDDVTFQCTLLVGDGVTEGNGEVLLRAHDAAFNPVEVSAAVRVDKSPPKLLSSSTTITAPTPINLAPRAATVGSVVGVTVFFDEAVSGVPDAVVLVPGDEACVDVVVDGSRLECRVTVASAEEGARLLRTTVKDEAGNSAAVDVPLDVVFDFAPPAAPDVATDGKVVYQRAPWGRDGDPAAVFNVVFAADVLDIDDSLAVFSDAGGSRLIAVGSELDINGVDLGAIDRSVVFVAAVDGAGLLSPVVAVQQQRFTTTFGSKQREDFNGNPHSAFAVAAFDDLREGSVVELSDAAYAAIGPGGDGGATAQTASSWQQLTPSTQPPPRSDGCLAYDSARGQAVLFGGRSGAVDLGDTWIFAGGAWQQQGPRTSPSPRSDVACAYDPVRDVVVLVGGAGTRDVWEWNGETWRLVDQVPTSGPVVHPVAVFDLDRSAVVVLADTDVFFVDGGDIVDGDFGPVDDGAAATSTEGFVVVDKDGTSKIIVAGQDAGTGSALPASVTTPIVYEDTAGVINVVITDDDGGDDRRFTLAGTTWTETTPLPIGDRRGGQAIRLGSDELGVLFFGGDNVDTAVVHGDVGDPIQTSVIADPSATAFDPGDADHEGGLIAVVGNDLLRLTDAGFVEVGDGRDGLLVDGTATSRARLVIDGGTVLELAGDEFASTFITDNDAISTQFVAGARVVRRGDDLVYVSATGLTFTMPTTNVWSAFGGATPIPAGGFGLATANGSVVLYPDVDGHTWTFDGATWSDLGVIGPGVAGARSNVALASDVDDGSAFLFGGADAGGVLLSEAWRFDGAGWTQVVDANGPGPRAAVVLGYDAHRHRMIAAGGIAGGSQIWAHNSGVADVAALRFDVSIGAARLGDDAVLTAVDVDTGGAPFLLWQAGRWDVADAAPLEHLLTGPEPTVHIAVPAAAPGPVTVLDFEATFSFRSAP